MSVCLGSRVYYHVLGFMVYFLLNPKLRRIHKAMHKDGGAEEGSSKASQKEAQNPLMLKFSMSIKPLCHIGKWEQVRCCPQK